MEAVNEASPRRFLQRESVGAPFDKKERGKKSSLDNCDFIPVGMQELKFVFPWILLNIMVGVGWERHPALGEC